MYLYEVICRQLAQNQSLSMQIGLIAEKVLFIKISANSHTQSENYSSMFIINTVHTIKRVSS